MIVEKGQMAERHQPVHKAAQKSVAELKALLDRDPYLRDERGQFDRHPIHVAAGAGQSDCVSLLLQRGASPRVVDGLHKWTPLHDAVSADSYECVDSLLRAGADPNAADTRGE